MSQSRVVETTAQVYILVFKDLLHVEALRKSVAYMPLHLTSNLLFRVYDVFKEWWHVLIGFL
jgi:hypothetical protein